MDRIVLQFSTTHAWQSGVIRFMCHSDFSHVDVIVPEPEPHGCLGASDPGGVALRPHDYQEFKYRQRMTIRMPIPGMADKFHDFVKAQLGKPFDDDGLRAVLDTKHREWRIPDKWFCSELVAAALEECGFKKIIVPKNRMTPGDLLLLLNDHIDPVEFYTRI